MKHFYLLLLALFGLTQFTITQEDTSNFLEIRDAKKSIELVDIQNKLSFEKLENTAEYQIIYNHNLENFNSTDKVIRATTYRNSVQSIWKDNYNISGVWKRCFQTNYMSGKIVWESLFELDPFATTAGPKWVFKGNSELYPIYDIYKIIIENPIVPQKIICNMNQYYKHISNIIYYLYSHIY